MTPAWVSIKQDATQRFEILGEIARGRMGVVYRLRDHALGRDVACKIPTATSLADPEAVRRFGDYLRIIAQLQHPGIPSVFDVGTLHDGRPFIIMKFIMGRTLDAILKEHIQSMTNRERLIPIFQEVCRTLAYAHFRGIVHRDVQPAHVMIGALGEIQVLGWGLAFAIPKDGSETVSVEDARHGAVFGNPAYMAPEQARGEATDVRSDVFGLGGLLCHILTGGPPYKGMSADAVAQIAAAGDIGDALVRLNGCGADAGLVALAKQCLQPRREDRPVDAGHVATFLVKSEEKWGRFTQGGKREWH